MSRANIYQGPDSCYARHHNVYVPGSGINYNAARGILSMIDRELRTGWTYDHSCRRIRMTPALARKRALYLIALARRHCGAGEARRVKELVYSWLERRGLLKRRLAVATATA
jgi:hypothetical protein